MTPNGHFRLAPGATKEGDLIFTILSLIGPHYLHGFWDGESLLGPMLSRWALKLVKDRARIDVPQIFNSETGDESHEDPRLVSVPLPMDGNSNWT
ncbi:hypothetical protein B0J11DRAFT_619453 [Dendryphion nanum]|uniref:Uncharacterized protein n=1 Tax=Dendryphion nanum TaxID=256645 RepID=A0A9P9D5J7_9PLEO|nr:hypothetical protein B0J11DRAFT_619453 [Dendryphion nanum]